nr:hypothetical protein [Stenotrophomonas pavanii]
MKHHLPLNEIKLFSPLLLYPFIPAAVGVALALAPRLTFAVMVTLVALIVLRRWLGHLAPIGGLSLTPTGLPVYLATLAATVMACQMVAAFVAGIALVAGWTLGWLVLVAWAPSTLTAAIAMAYRARLRRRLLSGK